MGGSTPKIPKTQPLQQPEQQPSVAVTRKNSQLTGPRPPAGTMLTGAEGVPASSLTVGSNVLLGA
jgi:hypothetical protein